MTKNAKPIKASDIAKTAKKSVYPEPFAAMMNGRIKRKLGDHFGLLNFGINLTELAPSAMSALKHQHLTQDEFIYILSGTPSLVYGDEEHRMAPGDCFGFKCGNGIAHHLVNNSDATVVYLEIGDRSPDDQVDYPDDDLSAKINDDGLWYFLHKDKTPY